MRRGTTPTIDIHISGIEPADVVRAYVTLKQGATKKHMKPYRMKMETSVWR